MFDAAGLAGAHPGMNAWATRQKPGEPGSKIEGVSGFCPSQKDKSPLICPLRKDRKDAAVSECLPGTVGVLAAIFLIPLKIPRGRQRLQEQERLPC